MQHSQSGNSFASNEYEAGRKESSGPVNEMEEENPDNIMPTMDSPYPPFYQGNDSSLLPSQVPTVEENEESLFVSDDEVNEVVASPADLYNPQLFTTNPTTNLTSASNEAVVAGESEEPSTNTTTSSQPRCAPRTTTTRAMASSSGQGRKRGHSSRDSATEEPAKKAKKGKKVSENTENLHWYEENHTLATIQSFQNFRDNVNSYVQRSNASFAQPPPQQLIELREQLHQLSFHQGITNHILGQSRIFDGLQMIWLNPDVFPQDMADFASELHWRWTNNRQTPNIYDGLLSQVTRSEGSTLRGWKLDEDETIRPRAEISSDGEGHLHNGQWWPKNLIAQLDGAHNDPMKGISGTKLNGACSIILSNFKENTEDEDRGDEITYCGEAAKPGKIASGTMQLLKAFERRNRIRVLRSANLPRSNPYRPARGIRYDGLYIIVSAEKLDTSLEQNGTTSNVEPRTTAVEEPKKTRKRKKSKKDERAVIKKVTHRFLLQRLPDQSPICPTGTPGARPTAQEIEAYDEAETLNRVAFQEVKRQAKEAKTASGQQEQSQTQAQAQDPFVEDNSSGESTEEEGGTATQAEDIEETEDAILRAALLESNKKS